MSLNGMYDPASEGPHVMVIPMTPELRAVVEGFRNRMQRAEQLLNDEQEFLQVFDCLPFEDYELMRHALAAYLRENRDPE